MSTGIANSNLSLSLFQESSSPITQVLPNCNGNRLSLDENKIHIVHDCNNSSCAEECETINNTSSSSGSIKSQQAPICPKRILRHQSSLIDEPLQIINENHSVQALSSPSGKRKLQLIILTIKTS